jgi:EAL domain-containing protein (putative c-di-GMP-specific phosphodiesterase class I)
VAGLIAIRLWLIDRVFVRDVAVNPDDAAITAANISMAKSLHFKVSPKASKNEAQVLFLRGFSAMRSKAINSASHWHLTKLQTSFPQWSP